MMNQLRDAITESVDAFSFLHWRWQFGIMGAIAAAIFMTVVAWKVMIPFLLLALGVIIYLRRSRDGDSL